MRDEGRDFLVWDASDMEKFRERLTYRLMAALEKARHTVALPPATP